MKKSIILKKVLIFIVILIFSIITLLEIIRTIGRLYYKITPDGGINEDMMIDINGSKQWISIYGKNKNNPVLLYLHGGPGSPTSTYDYKILRNWADIYTVVNWDQRNSGKSYLESQNNENYTRDLFIQDGKELTEFLLGYLNKEKISILGHSWGTSLGCALILTYPQYYETYIGAGQLIDYKNSEKALLEEFKKWAKDDEEGKKLIESLPKEYSLDYSSLRYEIMKRYNYDPLASGSDYNTRVSEFFCPYYSLIDLYKFYSNYRDWALVYMKFIKSEEFEKFSLLNITNYEVPYYNILGDRDYQTNHIQAEEYFELVKAPRKKLYIMKNMTHGLLLSRSEEFSDIVHDIYEDEYHSLNNTTPMNTTTTSN